MLLTYFIEFGVAAHFRRSISVELVRYADLLNKGQKFVTRLRFTSHGVCENCSVSISEDLCALIASQGGAYLGEHSVSIESCGKSLEPL